MIQPPRRPRTRTEPASLFLDDVSVARGDRIVVSGMNLRVRGGVVAVLGPNGCGKTTLLRTIATVAPIAGGSLRIDGLDPADPSQRTSIRQSLGYGPQATRFHHRARLFDAIDYVAALRLDLAQEARQLEVWRVIDELELRPLAGKRLEALSEGNRQRITLAQALLGPPRLVVLDEPLVALDPEIRVRAKQAIGQLGRRATVVVASHLVDEAAAMADVIVMLGDGRVMFNGTPDRLAELAGLPGASATDGYLAVRNQTTQPS